MEDIRREEKEALQALVEYSPRLLKAMTAVIEELEGNRQPDTDEYLLGIVKGMNWELQVLNGTIEYVNEEEQLIDKVAANDIIVAFNAAYQDKDDSKMSELFLAEIIPFFTKLAEVAKRKS